MTPQARGGAAPGAAPLARTAADAVLDYHERTKHRLDRYAAGPETLDWSAQPNPFREFAGSARLALRLETGHLSASFAQLHADEPLGPQPLTRESVGALLGLSFGLSAWKDYGPDRWALRCTPSSGNLHPTEAYVLCDQVPQLDNGVWHYVSRDHSLEQRCRLEWTHRRSAKSALWIGLSSVHWREAWKYGERAYRYCQLDLGHAIGAVCYAAATLGWTVRLVGACADAQLAALLGLDRTQDFAQAEREHPDLLLAVIPDPRPGRAQRDAAESTVPSGRRKEWLGRANVLDPHPLYHWPVIDEVASAARKPAPQRRAYADHRPRPAPYPGHAESPLAVQTIQRRRSAQHFDRKHTMAGNELFHLLECLQARHPLPWHVWPFRPQIHPILFVHRVTGLTPGVYAMPRVAGFEVRLSRSLHKESLWRQVEHAPEDLPLFQLFPGDVRQVARTLSCHQAIAADSCFSVALLAEFAPLVREEPWRYRQLLWEAGLLGQVLYLEAQTLGLAGTGIGCYFDDAVHQALGMRDDHMQSLYHFTVGRALVDERIRTTVPYADRKD